MLLPKFAFSRRLLLGLALLATACGEADDAPVRGPIELRLRLAPGATVAYRSVSSSEGRSDAPSWGGKPMREESTREFELIGKETDAEGVVSALYRWRRLKGKSSAGDVVEEFDSASEAPTPNPMLTFQLALIGRELPIRLSPAGRVLPLEGTLERAKEWFKDRPERPMLDGPGKEMFDDNLMRRSIAQGLVPLPDKPVSVGDSWPAAIELMPMGGADLEFKGTSTLTAATRSTATIRTEGTIHVVPLPDIDLTTAPIDEQMRRMNPRPVLTNTKLTITTVVARSDGLPLKQTSDLSLHLSIKRVVEIPADEIDHVSRTEQERLPQ
jgi:hypothetical protein